MCGGTSVTVATMRAMAWRAASGRSPPLAAGVLASCSSGGMMLDRCPCTDGPALQAAAVLSVCTPRASRTGTYKDGIAVGRMREVRRGQPRPWVCRP